MTGGEDELTAAIAAFEELLAHARPVPLTDQVRVRPQALRAAVERLDEAAWSAGTGFEGAEALAELWRIVTEAKPIPLTRYVRFDLRPVTSLLVQLRPGPERPG